MWNDRPGFDCLGQDVDAMIEARNAREWEELNYIPQHTEEALTKIGYAVSELHHCIHWLAEAAQEIDGTPEADAIDQVRIGLESLSDSITETEKALRGGVYA